MSLSILHNASAAVANRILAANEAGVSRSVARLSAGMRVIAARDDAAALAIGSGLRAEVASLKQASVNAGQAASMLQIADGAAAQIDKLLVRMRSLAVQSSSAQISDVERAMLDTEFQSLTSELDRIAKSTDSGDIRSHVFVTLLPKDTLENPDIPNSCQTCHKHKDEDLKQLQERYDELTRRVPKGKKVAMAAGAG